MSCEVGDMSTVRSYVCQQPGQDSSSQGGIIPRQCLSPARQQGWGGPRAFAASLQQSDAVLLPLLLALDAKCTPLCKHGFAFDGERKNPGLGKTESKMILDE